MPVSRITTIRQYQKKDIDRLVEKIGPALKDLPHYADTVYDPEITRATLEFNCGQDMSLVGYVICDPKTDIVVGGLSCAISQGFMSKDLYMWDIFFWIEPEWRSLANAEKLIIACRDWALRRGVKLRNIRSSVSSGYKMDKIGKLMEFMGMEEIGRIYQYRFIKHR